MTPRQLQAGILGMPETEPYRITPESPKDPEYLAKDQAIADILNAAGVGGSSRAVPCHLAKKLLIKKLKWRGIVEAASNAAHPARDAAFAAVALADDARMDADFLDPEAAPLLDALVAAGLIGADDRSALRAMCRISSAITGAEVSTALRGPWGDEGDAS